MSVKFLQIHGPTPDPDTLSTAMCLSGDFEAFSVLIGRSMLLKVLYKQVEEEGLARSLLPSDR